MHVLDEVEIVQVEIDDVKPCQDAGFLTSIAIVANEAVRFSGVYDPKS